MTDPNQESPSPERVRLESAMMQSVMNAFQRKAETLQREATTSMFLLEPAEKERLRSMTKVEYWKGFAVTMGCFVFLRRGPLMTARWIQQHFGRPPLPTSGPSEAATRHAQNSPFDRSSGSNSSNNINQMLPDFRQQNKFAYLGWLFIDTSLSLLAGITASLLSINTEEFLDEASELPLVPGKSNIAHEFCPVAIEAWNKLAQEHPQETYKPQTVYLQALRKFTMNCQRRQVMEDRIREESALLDDQLVDIPAPGVPITLEVADLGRAEYDASMDNGSMSDMEEAMWSPDDTFQNNSHES